MARQFNGTSDVLVDGNPSSLQLTDTFTVHVWMNNDTASGVQRPCGFTTAGANNGFSMATNGTGLAFTLHGVKDYVGGSFSANTLYSYLITIDSSFDAAFFLNGTATGTDTGTAAGNVNTVDDWHVAKGAAQFWDGMVSENAVWNIVLPTTLITALANGVNPFVIRNDALAFYSPIDGSHSPEAEYTGQNNLTVTGTTKIAHPPVELLENYL